MKIGKYAFWKRKEQFLLTEDIYPLWVFFAVQEGSFHYRIGNEEGIANEGSIIACPPSIPFYRQVIHPVTFHFIQCDFDETDLLHVKVKSITLEGGKLSVTDKQRCMDTITRLTQASKMQSPQNERLKDHLVFDLLFVCLTNNQPEPRQQTQDPLMNQAYALIRKQACQLSFQLKDIAAQLQLTPVQFTRRFQSAFQQTPISFVTALRIEQAKQLLTDTCYTLDKIAENCGYDSSYYLSRMFKQTTKMSPSEYRKTHLL